MIWSLQWRMAAILNGIRDSIAYRGEFILSLATTSLVPVFIQLTIWYSAFRLSGSTTFGGMTYHELVAYTWTSLLFSQIRGGDYDFTLDDMIQTGNLNNYLLRPVNVVEFVYFRSTGEKLLITLLSLCFGLIACAFTSMTVSNFLWAILLAIFGNLIQHQVGCIVVVLAFYMEQSFAALIAKNMIISLLSGELIPLNLFPANLAWIWKGLPFYLYVFAPAQIAMGRWDRRMIASKFLAALIWFVVLRAIRKWLWKTSIHRYQGQGG